MKRKVILFIILQLIVILNIYFNWDMLVNMNVNFNTTLIKDNKLFFNLILVLTQVLMVIGIIVMDIIIIHISFYLVNREVNPLKKYIEMILLANICSVLVNILAIIILKKYTNINIIFLTYIPIALIGKVLVLYKEIAKRSNFNINKAARFKVVGIYFFIIYLLSLVNVFL